MGFPFIDFFAQAYVKYPELKVLHEDMNRLKAEIVRLRKYQLIKSWRLNRELSLITSHCMRIGIWVAMDELVGLGILQEVKS